MIRTTSGYLKLSLVFAVSGGVQAMAAEYEGSSFNEVQSILNDETPEPVNSYDLAEWLVYRENRLPQYSMNWESIFEKDITLQTDAKRTLSEQNDYYPRLTKKLHPNGVCVSGQWSIDRFSKYSGLFKTETKALFVGRISVAMESTDFESRRGFGFAGKIFPTTDQSEIVRTANFFTVDVLTGQSEQYFMKTATTNEPAVGIPEFWNISRTWLGIKIKKALEEVDSNPGFRPLTPIAASGEVAVQVKMPKWIRLKTENGQITNHESDFRNEVLRAISDNRILKVGIYVSDTDSDRNNESAWTRIGTIELDKAVVSYGCDRRLHFAHPAK